MERIKVLLPLLVALSGCSARPSLTDPDTLTRNWFDQTWPGYAAPRMVVRENVDTQAVCGSSLGCSTYSAGDCLILLSPIANTATLEHEEMHCLLRHNGQPDDADLLYPVRFGMAGD